MKILNLIIGRRVKADHPVTCLNPEETFIVTQVEIKNDTIYVRGDKTMWFAEGLVKLVDSKKMKKPQYVVLEGIQYGNRFMTMYIEGDDPTKLQDGTVAYKILGYAETSEEGLSIIGPDHIERAERAYLAYAFDHLTKNNEGGV